MTGVEPLPIEAVPPSEPEAAPEEPVTGVEPPLSPVAAPADIEPGVIEVALPVFAPVVLPATSLMKGSLSVFSLTSLLFSS